ncbi:MAG: helix-turn-helix domain-containing protein [Comamonas sp.]
MTSILKAVELVGGVTAFAKALGVRPPTISQWLRGQRPVPAERCPAIERLTQRAVTCEQLRPDVEWSVLRRANTQESTANG